MANLSFKKTGHEIREAISNRTSSLQARLDKRNEALETLLNDRKRLRSYLVRSFQPNYTHSSQGNYTLFGADDISSEEKEEIDQLVKRIFEIEQEIRRLKLITDHLDPDEVFKLTYIDLVSYGFE